MNLKPIFNSSGKLLGHINLDYCRKDKYAVIVDETAGRILSFNPDDNTGDTTQFFKFPFRTLWFRWDKSQEVCIIYLVTDEDIPDWVWKSAGVKFNGLKDWWEKDRS